MSLEKLASAIHNNVMGGLKGVTVNIPFTLEQVEDGIVNERMQIIKEYATKNIIPINDLTYSIRCIEVDCESLERCPCKDSDCKDKMKHFEIPQVFTEFGAKGIDYVGSTDGLEKYKVYTDSNYTNHKNKRRGAEKPYVWIDTTPNKNNRLDGFIFNASPLLKNLLVRIIPKDPRQIDYPCCEDASQHNISFIDNEIERRLTEKYLRWYRDTAPQITPNDQTVK